MRSAAGFTLVEVVIALAISVILVTAIQAAVAGTTRHAQTDEIAGRILEHRLRTLEIMQSDLRGRMRARVETSLVDDGSSTLALSTTADTVGAPSCRRGIGEVRYIAGPGGLRRVEVSSTGTSELSISSDPASFEFLSGGAWHSRGTGAFEALRVNFGKPEESLVLR
jgi:prepilin-type N-terminal cleavage/methylation domain-containing protein